VSIFFRAALPMLRVLPFVIRAVGRWPMLSTAAPEPPAVTVAPTVQTRLKHKVSAYQAYIAATLKGNNGQPIKERLKAAAVAWKAIGVEARAQYQAKAEELNAHRPEIPVRIRAKRSHQLKPFHPLSTYGFFVKDTYSSIPADGTVDRFKAMSAAWKALTPEEKAKYQEGAAAENLKRQAAWAQKHAALQVAQAPKPKTKAKAKAKAKTTAPSSAITSRPARVPMVPPTRARARPPPLKPSHRKAPQPSYSAHRSAPRAPRPPAYPPRRPTRSWRRDEDNESEEEEEELPPRARPRQAPRIVTTPRPLKKAPAPRSGYYPPKN